VIFGGFIRSSPRGFWSCDVGCSWWVKLRMLFAF
jgi:hypothetical protein